jgi:hypothetical protein
MTNVFRWSPLTYFQMPEAIIESGVFAQLSPSAQSLYTLLLYLAQKTSSTVIKLTASDAAKVGLSPRSVKPAREDLVKHELIAATGNHHGFTYEVLDPITGQTLELLEDLINVDAEVIGEYFVEHLTDYDPQELNMGMSVGLRAWCPFHERSSERPHPLHVTFANGGLFKCNEESCEVKGGIIDFTMAMAKKNGETLSKNQAWGRVRSSLLSIRRRQSRRKAQELAEARAMM